MSPDFATVLIDPPTAFAVAALFVLLAAPMVRRAGRAGWYGVVGPAFAAWMAGVFGFMFFRYPDWMFCYLIEARKAPLGWLFPIFVLAMVGSGAAGALLAARAVLDRKNGRAVALVLLGLATWGVLFALTSDQYLHLGSTLEYRQGIARPITADASFQTAASLAGILAVVPGLGLGLILIFEAWRTRRAAAILPAGGPEALPDLGGGPPLGGASPLDGNPLPPVPTTRPEQIPAVLAAARAAGVVWAAFPAEARASALARVRERFLAAADDAAALSSRETGKPAAEAYTAEIVPNADLFAYWAREAPRLLQPTPVALNPLLYPGKRSEIQRVPRGVVGLISPWNYPLSIPLRALLPALASGNAVVFKPSELTPRCGAFLASLFAPELPPGVLQVVQGGGDVGAALVSALPDLVSFTGSTATGRRIAELAAKGPVPLSLELGGKDAAIVLEDADLDRTVAGVTWGAFTNAGQNCCSIQRVFVVETIADRFLAALARRAREVTTSGPSPQLGPVVNERQLSAVMKQVEEARAAGAEPLAGGDPTGLRLPATVLLVDHARNGALSLLRDETFGPVVAVEIVADEAEAIARANDTPFGLAASVWTHDLARGERIARRLSVGTVTVNNVAFTPALPMAPWSGTGASGYGVTNSPLSLEAFTRPRYVLVDGSRKPELWWYPYDQNLLAIVKGLAGLQSRTRRSLGLLLATGKAFLARGAAQGKKAA